MSDFYLKLTIFDGIESTEVYAKWLSIVNTAVYAIETVDRIVSLITWSISAHMKTSLVSIQTQRSNSSRLFMVCIPFLFDRLTVGQNGFHNNKNKQTTNTYNWSRLFNLQTGIQSHKTLRLNKIKDFTMSIWNRFVWKHFDMVYFQSIEFDQLIASSFI